MQHRGCVFWLSWFHFFWFRRPPTTNRTAFNARFDRSKSPPSLAYRGHAATRRATVTLGEASWGLLSGSPEYMVSFEKGTHLGNPDLRYRLQF